MFKKISGFLLSIMILFSLTACGHNKNENTSTTDSSNNHFLMWKVTNDSYNGEFYLMGSIHAAKNDIYPLPDKVVKAYDSCDNLAVECDIVSFEKQLKTNKEEALNYLKSYMYDDGTKIYDHIEQETYDKAKKLIQENSIYISAYDKMKPAMWLSLLEDASLRKVGLDMEQGLDTHFINKAQQEQKNILEIESVEFQNEMLSNFSDKTYNLLLKSYTENSMDEISKNLTELYDAVIKGDFEEAEDANEEDYSDMTDEEKKLVDDYNKVMLTNRNKGMADKAMEYIKENKSVFFIVGAAHMVGDEGIIKLLQNNGYTVTRY